MKKIIPIGLVAGLMIFSHISQAQYVFTRVDINSGANNSSPGEMRIIDTTLYFQADNGANGTELWMSDGTTAGTQMIRDINSGALGSSPKGFSKYNGKVYFSANDGINGNELWVTDGTSSGTKLVADINTGGASSNPEWFFAHNGKLFFRANNGTNGRELYVTDGTASGTSMLKDIRAGGAHSDPMSFFEVNNTLVFAAQDGSSGYQIWTSDGTTSGTVMLKNIAGGSTDLTNAAIYNGDLYFAADAGGSIGGSFWITDGTGSGTQMVRDIDPAVTINAIRSPIVVMNNLMFFSTDSSGYVFPYAKELWVSDGTATGTGRISSIWPGFFTLGNAASDIKFPLAVDSLGLVFFRASDSVHASELWASDGTPAGTYMVKDIMGNGPNGKNASSVANHLVSYAGKAFFAAFDTLISNCEQLWVSDGTDTGTKKLLSYLPAPSNFLEDAVACKNFMAFSGRYDSTGYELWIMVDTNFGKKVDTTHPPISVSGQQINEKGMHISPNPATGEVSVTIDPNFHKGVLLLTDISGRVVRRKELADGERMVSMDLRSLTPATYIMTLVSTEGSFSKRLVVE